MSTESLDAGVSPVQGLRSLTPFHWAGIVLAAITGAIHVWLGVSDGKLPLLAAGLGFAIGIIGVALDVRREELVRAGITFTAIQVVLYALLHAFLSPRAPHFAPIGLVDKAVQIGLVGALLVLHRRS